MALSKSLHISSWGLDDQEWEFYAETRDRCFNLSGLCRGWIYIFRNMSREWGGEKWPRNDHPGSSSIWRGCFFYRRSLLYHRFFYQRSLSDMVPPSHAVPSVLLPFKWFVREASRQEMCGQSWDLGPIVVQLYLSLQQ